jgi:hypothetical protein
LWVRVPLVLVGLTVGGTIFLNTLRDSPAGVPKCDAADARELMKNAIEQNASANTSTLRLLDLTDTSELSYSAEKKERLCQGMAFLNSGKTAVQYRMWLTANNRMLIEVNEKPLESPSSVSEAQPARPQSTASGSPAKAENLLLKGGWDRTGNAAAAISEFVARQQDDGVSGVIDEVQKCHAALPGRPNPQKVEYCILLDVQARNYYLVVEKAKGWPPHEFWDEDAFLERQYPLLASVGVPQDEYVPALTAIDQAAKRAAKAWAEAQGRK